MSRYTLRLLGGPADGEAIHLEHPAQAWDVATPGRQSRYVVTGDGFEAVRQPTGAIAFEAIALYDGEVAQHHRGVRGSEPERIVIDDLLEAGPRPVATDYDPGPGRRRSRRGIERLEFPRMSSALAGAFVALVVLGVLALWHALAVFLIDRIGWTGLLIAALGFGAAAGLVAWRQEARR